MAFSSYTDILPTLGQLHAILEFLINLNNENINKLTLQEICEKILGHLRVNYPNLHDILECNQIIHRLKVNYLDIEESIEGYECHKFILLRIKIYYYYYFIFSTD